MADPSTLCSEADELADFLDALQRNREICEVSGRDSGFAAVNAALDGLLPGVHVLLGAPGIGKTSFAKQLLDQVAQRNRAPAIFFSFGESKHELRIGTLARLTGMDRRDIRRGSAYLLHWFGVPRLGGDDARQLAPSWDKVRRSAEEAAEWLSFVYLVECARHWRTVEIERAIGEIATLAGTNPAMIVIDNGQRLGDVDQPFDRRLPIMVEQLDTLANHWQAPSWVTWPDLDSSGSAPELWGDKIPGAAVVAVMQLDMIRNPKLPEPDQAILVQIVKNRGGEKCKLAFDFSPGFARFKEV